MLRVKLFSAAGVGVRSELLSEVDVSPTKNNGYPDMIVWKERYFVPTPVMSEYREIQPYFV